VILSLAVFFPRDAMLSYAKRGICRRRVSVCVSVCVSVRHTPVLYQNSSINQSIVVYYRHDKIEANRLNVGSHKLCYTIALRL